MLDEDAFFNPSVYFENFSFDDAEEVSCDEIPVIVDYVPQAVLETYYQDLLHDLTAA